MKTNDKLEKEYQTFIEALEGLKTAEYVPETHSVISQDGMIVLFHACCDCAYLFIKNSLEFQGYIFPVTAYPQTVIRTACQFGIIDNEDRWLEIIEIRNNIPHNYDKKKTAEAVKKIKTEYISDFEAFEQIVDCKLSDKINEAQHNELINILDELIDTIRSMNPTNRNYFLNQNLREAKDWLNFLKANTDKEELMSLNKEIAERFVHKYEAIDHEYDVKFGCFDLDRKRLDLMEEFLGKLWRYIS